jgi:hypothetical protein
LHIGASHSDRWRLESYLRVMDNLTAEIRAAETVAVPEPNAALAALYKAYVAPRGGGGGMPTKGVVLDGL